MTRQFAGLKTFQAILVSVALSGGSGYAAEATIDDPALQGPMPPELPDGTKPTLRDCKITTAQSIGPAGETVETTHRTCHWAVPPASADR